MSSSELLRQVSVAMTLDGVIGDGPNLLFNSRLDLAEFYEFSKKTILIVGRHTAQQLIEYGVYPTQDRPFLVISEKNLINAGPVAVGTKCDKFAACERWLLYTESLQEAIPLAEKYAKVFNLVGWTVVGGKKVYDELFERVDKTNGAIRLNRAYIFTVQEDLLAPTKPVKLDYDYDRLCKMLRNRFVDPASFHLITDTHLNVQHHTVASSSVAVRGSSCVTFITDKEVFDTNSAHLNKTHLKVYTTIGEVWLLRDQIEGWHAKRGASVVDVYMKNGRTHDLRVENIPQQEWLMATLKRL